VSDELLEPVLVAVDADGAEALAAGAEALALGADTAALIGVTPDEVSGVLTEPVPLPTLLATSDATLNAAFA
jgi:hypothetical protein